MRRAEPHGGGDGGGEGGRASASFPLVLAHAPRERTRAVLRARVSRRRVRVVVTRSVSALERRLRAELVDAVVVDLGAPAGDALDAAALAREYPSVAFLAVTPFRPVDAPAIAQCAAFDVVDVLADGVDDALLPHTIATHGFSARFALALEVPPPPLGLTSPLQLAAWRWVVARAGRAVRTQELADALRVTREHLSRSFASAGSTLKRVIDLVRLLAAAQLAKNPGYDVRDVAHVLGYSSPSHLSSTAERLVGTRAESLARLRAVDLVGRFVRRGGDGGAAGR